MSQNLAIPLEAKSPHAINSDIPARLDRLPWGRFHWLLIRALGVTWILDGLEAPVHLGGLVGTDRRAPLVAGRLLSAALMIAGAAIEWWPGVDSEGKALEDVAAPLSSQRPSAA